MQVQLRSDETAVSRYADCLNAATTIEFFDRLANMPAHGIHAAAVVASDFFWRFPGVE